jgi:anti-sigma regulatory factor (Ser/Thr protein kinase)
MRVGGDWYDVVQLGDRLIGLAIGDVAGHGPQAAATMGQLRMAVRAYALENPSPVAVLTGVHRLMAQLPMPEMVTLLYLVFDPDCGTLRFTNAGHPPALVVGNGRTRYLYGGLAPPLGVTAEPDYIEEVQALPPGATLLIYTDGLVERRNVSIQDGLDRLLREADQHDTDDVGDLCDHLLSALSEDAAIGDDIALLAVRPLSLAGAPLVVTVPAEPRVLVEIRQALRRWLRQAGIGERDENELLVACGEACANVIRHAYHVVPGMLEVEARLVDQVVELTVRDQGRWRAPADRGGGWGYGLMEGLMSSVDVRRGSQGTEVTMTRRVRIGEPR